jgi:putative oxidoreductase
MNDLHGTGLLLGRVLLALIFIISGFGKVMAFSGTAGYMAAEGMPMPQVLLVAAIAIELGGGLMLVAGYKARWAAFAILLFLIPATLIFHDFWAVPPEQVRAQVTNFEKNLAIMGGMLYVMFCGPGRYSIDRV